MALSNSFTFEILERGGKPDPDGANLHGSGHQDAVLPLISFVLLDVLKLNRSRHADHASPERREPLGDLCRP